MIQSCASRKFFLNVFFFPFLFFVTALPFLSHRENPTAFVFLVRLVRGSYHEIYVNHLELLRIKSSGGHNFY